MQRYQKGTHDSLILLSIEIVSTNPQKLWELKRFFFYNNEYFLLYIKLYNDFPKIDDNLSFVNWIKGITLYNALPSNGSLDINNSRSFLLLTRWVETAFFIT